MKTSELINRRSLVAGLGLSGQSVVRYLTREGVAFELADERATSNETDPLDSDVVIHREFTASLFCSFDVIILSPGIPRSHPAIVAALVSGVSVIGDIELFADAVRVPVIAVTGSNGKSTVVAWLAHTLNACGVKAAACGNIGEPALDSLQRNADVLVLELSSYQLESTKSLRPLAATVLNISEDHLDRYDSLEHYAAVKRRVYAHALHCLANLDDERTWPVDDTCQSCACFTLSLDNDKHRVNNCCDDNPCTDNHWQRSILNNVTLALPGDHNVANALAVLALAEPLEVPVDQLLAALTRFHGLAHRSEFIGEHQGVRWYNDSKGTNTDACEKAIRAMAGPVLLIAGGIGKGADFSLLRQPVSECVRLLILIGQDRQVMAGQLQGCSDIRFADTLRQAVILAHDNASDGDVVLLSPACSSFDMFRNFEDRGEQFTLAAQEVMAA